MLRIAPQGPAIRSRQRLAQRIYGGYSYNFYREKAGIIYVKCSMNAVNDCNAFGRIINGEVELLRTHSHPADRRLRIAHELINMAYVAVTTEMRSLSSIYNRLIEQHPESMQLFEKKCFMRRMNEWRDTLKMQPVATYTELVAQLVSVERRVCRVHERGNVEVLLASDNGVPEAVIFFDRDLINLLSQCRTFSVGSTRATLPADFEGTKELVVVTAIYKKHTFPCVWALMRHRSVRAFLTLLNPLTATVTPEKIYTNFDARLHEAARTTFPESSVRGDYLAYCMTVLDTAREVGVDLDDATLRKGVKQVLGLALLPSHRIGAAFDALVASVHREHNREFSAFLDAFDGTWIHVVTPEQFSVYRRPDAITNCTLSIIQRLANRVGRQPNIVKFTGELIRSHGQVHLDVGRRLEDASVSVTPQVKGLVNNTYLTRLWQQLSREEIGDERFLEICVNFLEPLLALLVYRQGPIFNDFRAYTAVARDEAVVARDENIEARDIDADAQNAQEVGVVDNPMQGDENGDGDGEVGRCIICRINVIQYACMPCLHVAFCATCAQECERNSVAQQQPLRCPLCRSPSIGFNRVYLPADM